MDPEIRLSAFEPRGEDGATEGQTLPRLPRLAGGVTGVWGKWMLWKEVVKASNRLEGIHTRFDMMPANPVFTPPPSVAVG